MSKRRISNKKIKETLTTKPSLTFRVLQMLFRVVGFISIGTWVFIDFNLGNFALVWISVIVGLIIAFIISLFVERWMPEIAIREKKKRSDIGLLLGIIFLNVTPLSLQYLNGHFFNSNLRCKSYEVLSKDHYHSWRRAMNKFEVSIDNQKITLDCDENLLDNLTVGKNIEICIANGGLGFDYIKGMKTR